MQEEKLSIGSKLFDSLQQLNEGDSSLLTVLRVGGKQVINLVKEVDTKKINDAYELILTDYNEIYEG